MGTKIARTSISLEDDLYQAAQVFALDKYGHRSFSAYVAMLVKRDLEAAGVWPIKKTEQRKNH